MDTDQTPIINLALAAGNGGAPFLSGRERGEQARTLFHLNELDGSKSGVIVKIPDSILSISSSYSIGLFSKSVETLGSIDSFVKHFQFEGHQAVIEKIISALAHGEAGPPILE